MLAHLSRKQLVKGDAKTGVLEYRSTGLRWSGERAEGDEINQPVCIVIDVGRRFTITHDGQLYLTGAGKAQYQTFSPSSLFTAATPGWFGFTLLWDESDDEGDDDAVPIGRESSQSTGPGDGARHADQDAIRVHESELRSTGHLPASSAGQALPEVQVDD